MGHYEASLAAFREAARQVGELAGKEISVSPDGEDAILKGMLSPYMLFYKADGGRVSFLGFSTIGYLFDGLFTEVDAYPDRHFLAAFRFHGGSGIPERLEVTPRVRRYFRLFLENKASWDGMPVSVNSISRFAIFEKYPEDSGTGEGWMHQAISPQDAEDVIKRVLRGPNAGDIELIVDLDSGEKYSHELAVTIKPNGEDLVPDVDVDQVVNAGGWLV